jgi:hypothetical protein
MKVHVHMPRYLVVLSLLIAAPMLVAAQPPAPAGWKAKVAQTMPLLGHRNWILIVDSAYPLQTSAGVETVETNASQAEVAGYVLGVLNHSIHVRPDLFMDAELPFVPDQDAPGASAYRKQIGQLLNGYKVESLPHEQIIAKIDEAGKLFHVLVLKTNMAVPYTSIFIRLNCKYWSDEAEKRMRARMSEDAAHRTQPSK